MSTPAPTTPDPIQENDTIFWQDMNAVLAEKQADAVQDNLIEDREDQIAINRLQSIIDNQSNSINGPSTSPIDLASGASAPTTKNSVTKMNNNLNGV